MHPGGKLKRFNTVNQIRIYYKNYITLLDSFCQGTFWLDIKYLYFLRLILYIMQCVQPMIFCYRGSHQDICIF